MPAQGAVAELDLSSGIKGAKVAQDTFSPNASQYFAATELV